MSELENGYRISDIVGIAIRRWPILVGAAVVGAIAGFSVFASAPTTFSATARVEVKQLVRDNGTTGDLESEMTTQLDAVKADGVTAAVIEALDLDDDARAVRRRITVTNKPKSLILEITFVAPTADEARDGANTVALAYLNERTRLAQADQTATRDTLQQQLSAVAGEVEEARKVVDAAVAGTAEHDAAEAELRELERSRNKVQESLAALPELGADAGGRIVTEAPTPEAVTSKMALGKGVGVFGVCIVIGFAVAWLLDRRDGLSGGRRKLEQLLPNANFRVMPNADGRSASPAEIDTAIDRLAVELASGGEPGRATSVLVIGAGNEPPVALAEELASSLAFAGIPALFVLAGSSEREVRHAQVITSFADLLQGPTITGPAGLPETAGAMASTTTATGPSLTWLRPRGSAEASGLLRRAVVETLVTRAGRERFEAVVFVAASPARTAASTALGQWVQRNALVIGPDDHGVATEIATSLIEADVTITEVVWT